MLIKLEMLRSQRLQSHVTPTGRLVIEDLGNILIVYVSLLIKLAM